MQLADVMNLQEGDRVFIDVQNAPRRGTVAQTTEHYVKVAWGTRRSARGDVLLKTSPLWQHIAKGI